MALIPCCRFCDAPLTQTFVDLGAMPLANAYPTPEDVAAGREARYPLHARVCPSCLLVQVDEAVPPEAIFGVDYAYLSSMSAAWVEHARRYADAMVERFGLGPASLVVEVASNDGYLLRHFRGRGVPVLGIEPAPNVADMASAQGIPTRVQFFDADSAAALRAEGLAADLMVANNVVAHVPRIAPFLAGFVELLKPLGVVTFEFPHVLSLIRGCQFDTIYHEHFSYLSLHIVERAFSQVGLLAYDCETLPTHGGSLRVFAGRADHPRPVSLSVLEMRTIEREAGLDTLAGYGGFAGTVERAKQSFRTYLDGARAEGRKVAAYGAAAKGNTFLNACGVTAQDIVAVFDRAPTKIGRLTPGSHIPILPPDALEEVRPDDLVILPWNLEGEIRRQCAGIAAWGGRFVIAIPQTRIEPA